MAFAQNSLDAHFPKDKINQFQEHESSSSKRCSSSSASSSRSHSQRLGSHTQQFQSLGLSQSQPVPYVRMPRAASVVQIFPPQGPNSWSQSSYPAPSNQSPKKPRRQRKKPTDINVEPSSSRKNNKQKHPDAAPTTKLLKITEDNAQHILPSVPVNITLKKPRASRASKNAAMIQSSVSQKEEYEREHMLFSKQYDTQTSSNIVEDCVVKFNANGVPETMTTRFTEEKKETTQEKIAIEWQKERIKRESMIQTLMSMPEHEALGKSRGLKWYEEQVMPHLKLFYELQEAQKDELRPENNKSAWTNYDFVMRFLFNMKPHNPQWKKEHWPDFNSPPWLACCWTMKEMLGFCNNVDFVKYVLAAKSPPKEEPQVIAAESDLANKPNTIKVVEPTLSQCRLEEIKGGDVTHYSKRFIIDSTIMAGYVSGHLLGHHIPALRSLMQRANGERDAPYFPTFHDLTLQEDTPMTLRMSYNFHLVQQHEDSEACTVPASKTRFCEPQSLCFCLGLDGEVDGPLLQLMSKASLKQRCFAEVQKLALKQPEENPAEVVCQSLLKTEEAILADALKKNKKNIL